MQQLSQNETTLENARAQAVLIRIRSSRQGNKEEEIRQVLSKYYPDWTAEQIESEQKLLFELATIGTNSKSLLEERFVKVKMEREKNAKQKR
jgi:hypothetical protein